MTGADPWADDVRGAGASSSSTPPDGVHDTSDWRRSAGSGDAGAGAGAGAAPADDPGGGLHRWLEDAPDQPIASPAGAPLSDAAAAADGVGPTGDEAAVAPAARRGAKAKRKRRRRRPTSRVVAEYGILAAFAIVLAFLIRTFVGLAFYIPSESMVPTLKVHDRVIVTRVSYHLHDPRRGDIIVFDNPNFDEPRDSLPKRILRDALEVVGINQPKDKNLIKRVVGLPGETIQGRDGQVFVDGRQLPETYLPAGVTTTDFGPVAIPKGRLWVMGDNRPNSADSRYFGTIARSSVVGRAFVRIWPPWRLGLL